MDESAAPPVAAERADRGADGRRPGYHHGDLRNALVETGLALARDGGPEAVVLREVARRTGVSATAAYRHFADHAALIQAVKERAQRELVAAMRGELGAVAATADPTAAALARLRAIGAAYIRFALAEPGLFRLGFDRPEGEPVAYTGRFESDAFALLSGLLDQLAATGHLSPERRPGTEIAVWSAVHGLAMLLVSGPLRGMTTAERETAVRRLLDLVVAGVTGDRAPNDCPRASESVIVND